LTLTRATVAVALLVHGAIWTEDQDYFGCGLAT
jgi:PIN domain